MGWPINNIANFREIFYNLKLPPKVPLTILDHDVVLASYAKNGPFLSPSIRSPLAEIVFVGLPNENGSFL